VAVGTRDRGTQTKVHDGEERKRRDGGADEISYE